jgi:hypothetical protein
VQLHRKLVLGIGCERGTYSGVMREWLYWYDEEGKRYPTPEEQIKQANKCAAKLAEKLRELGIDPNIVD